MLTRYLRALCTYAHIRNPDQKAGFTLIEALVTVSMLALFTALMMPSLHRVNPALNLEQRANALRSLIKQARTLAIAHDKRVFLCGAAPDAETSMDIDSPCDLAGSWRHGVLVVIDQDGDEEPSTGDVVTLYQPAGSRESVLSWRGFRGKSRVEFLPNGMTYWQNGRFTLCAVGDKTLRRDVIINAAGRS
jgi:type IV fimbrial biogenesis protein FimT